LDRFYLQGFNHHQTELENMMIAIEKSLQLARKVQPLNVLQNLNTLILLWINRYRQRKLLSSLEEHALKDIGISRVDALKESNKPFWMP
jgi:uncharacterized protein YjiS (DUF1127 family)